MLTAFAERVIRYAWIVFFAVWFVAVLTKKPRDKSARGDARFRLGVVLIVVALILVSRRFGHSWLAVRWIPDSPWLVLPGVVLTFAGIALALWARFHLGRNWGPPSTMRVGHELVTKGPYAYVRHPIYTGIDVAIVGTALVIGNWLFIAIAATVILSFWRAARIENALLVGRFGEQAERR